MDKLRWGNPGKFDVARRGRIALFLLLALPLFTACSYLSPYVPLTPAVERQSNDLAKMPQLASVTANIDAWMTSTEKLRGEVTTTRRAFDLATFGLLTAAGVKTAHASSANAIKNLALGGAGVYSASSLFLPAEQGTVYGNGTVALQCLRSRATGLQSAVITAAVVENNTTLEQDVKAIFDQCPVDPVTAGNLTDAISARTAALGVLTSVRATDGAVANKVKNAAMNVVVTLNAQLDSLRPDPAALLGSARSLETIALGLVAAPAVAGGAAVGVGAVAPAAVCHSLAPAVAALNQRLVGHKAEYQGYADSLSQAVNAVGDLSTACTVSALVVAPLSFSQDHVVVSQDVSFNIIVSGGREPLQQPTFDTSSGDGVRATLIPPRTIVVSGTSKITAGKTYKVQLRDNSSSAGTATLTIDTK